MPVRVGDFDVSVVKGSHRFTGLEGSASIDMEDGQVTIASNGVEEDTAAAAFHAGMQAQARLGKHYDNNAEILGKAPPTIPLLPDEPSRRDRGRL